MNINMKHYLCFLAILAVVHCELQAGFRARIGSGGVEEVDKTIFFSLPHNVTQATCFGWSETARPEGPLSSLVMYCPETPTVCVLFDDADYAAGVQVALNKTQISDAVLDWSTQGFTSWKTKDGTEYWTQHQYFGDEEYLAKSKEDRIANRKANEVLQLDSIWITGQDGELVRISKSREDIENKNSIFTKQGCYPRMGQHYFYNMTTSTECTSRGLYPWFLITGSDRLIATGFSAIGTYPTPSEGREWLDARGNAALFKFDKSRISGQVLDWTAQGFVSWTTDDGKEHWAQHQYFVNEDFLAKSTEDRLAAIDSDKLLHLGSIWLTGINGTLDRISTSRKDIEDSIFTIQSCISGMGQHFFYNMSSTFECSSNTIYPWFLITDADGLIATGLITTGIYNSTGQKEWFEAVDRDFAQTIVPYGPECYYDYGENPGVLSLHTYYVDKPLEIICPL